MIIKSSDFNVSFSEFPLNEYRREFPDTAKRLINVKPGTILEPEGAIITTLIAGQDDLPPNAQAKAFERVNELIYFIVAAESKQETMPFLDTISFILYSYNGSTITNLSGVQSFAVPQYLTMPQYQYQVTFDYSTNQLFVVVPTRTYVYSPNENSFIRQQDLNTAVTINDIHYTATVSTTELLSEYLKDNLLPSTHRTQAGYFMNAFPSLSNQITEGGFTGNISTGDIGNLNPSQTEILALWNDNYSQDPIDGDVVVNTNGNILQNWAFDGTDWRQNYTPLANVIGHSVELSNVTSTTDITFIFQPIIKSGNATIQTSPIDVNNSTFTLPNDNSNQVDIPVNINLNTGLANQLFTVTPPLTNNSTDPQDKYESFTMNITGSIPLYTPFTHIRVFRTTQQANSNGGTLHFVEDLLIDSTGTFRYQEYTGWNNPTFTINPIAFDSVISRESIIFNEFGMWSIGSIISGDDPSNAGIIPVNSILSMDGYVLVAFGNQISTIQPRRDGFIGANNKIYLNRGIIEVPENIISMYKYKDDVLVLTYGGLYSIDNLSTNVFMNQSNNINYFTFRKSPRRLFGADFNLPNQIYICSQNQVLIMDNAGSRYDLDGNIITDWGYKDRYANITNLNIGDSLTRIVWHTGRMEGILEQEFTTYLEDELHQGYATYTRNYDGQVTTDNPTEVLLIPSLLNPSILIGIYIERNEVGEQSINVIRMFDDNETNDNIEFILPPVSAYQINITKLTNILPNTEVWLGYGNHMRRTDFFNARNGITHSLSPKLIGYMDDTFTYTMSIQEYAQYQSNGGAFIRLYKEM